MSLSHKNPNFQRFRKDDAPFIDFLKYDFMTKEGFDYVRPDVKDKFNFIGSVDYFNESIHTLANMCGVAPVSMGARHNTTPRQFDWKHLSAKQQDEVKSLLKEEIDFYEEIKSLRGK